MSIACSVVSSVSPTTVTVLPKEPHQPRNIRFPQREFGKKSVVKRSFQPAWFGKWPWLHYVEDEDKVLCFTCCQANSQKKLQWSGNAESAFLVKGFTNWKDTTVKFSNHESSKCHKEAVLKMVTLPSTTVDVGESLSQQHKQEKRDNRQCFLKVVSNLKFLSRQGLSLRGHGDGSDSNFLQLLKLRQEDDKRIKTWMDKKANNYTAPDMQNEILREMALQVLRQVIASVQAAQFFTIMVDETTDVSNNEQVVICFQWVDGELEAHEEFVGLYETNSTHAQVLHSLIHDVLLRTNLSITRLRGQCYDGASSMLGARGGVAKLILDEEPRALHTHCYGHALNLACSDAVKGCKVMRDVLDTSYAIVKLIKKSPRRDAMLKNLRQQLPETTPGIRVLCPTRWTVRAKSLQSIIDNFNVLQELWDESLDVVKETEMRATIIGVSSCMKTFNFFFGLVLGDLVLRHSDNLSKTLQSLQISAAEGQKVADMTVTTLQSIRSDANFDLFWSKVTRMATHCEVEDPVLPRRRKRPRRYEHGSAEGDFASDVKSFYRSIYFEALDLVTSAIKARFDQPGYKVYCKLEDLLVKGANDEKFGEELTFITDFYKDDFDSAQLEMQLKVMSSNLTQVPPNDLHSLLKYLRSISTSQRVLMSQVCKLASLILVMPATNASCERSFSSLRRVKTYLRATMTQSRLNNIMMLHIHKECTDQLNLIDLGNAFVRNSHHRETLFGKFLPNDLEVDI